MLAGPAAAAARQQMSPSDVLMLHAVLQVGAAAPPPPGAATARGLHDTLLAQWLWGATPCCTPSLHSSLHPRPPPSSADPPAPSCRAAVPAADV